MVEQRFRQSWRRGEDIKKDVGGRDRAVEGVRDDSGYAQNGQCNVNGTGTLHGAGQKSSLLLFLCRLLAIAKGQQD